LKSATEAFSIDLCISWINSSENYPLIMPSPAFDFLRNPSLNGAIFKKSSTPSSYEILLSRAKASVLAFCLFSEYLP